MNDRAGSRRGEGAFTDAMGRLWEDSSRRRLLLPAVEINSVSRCNLACVGCSRSSPAARAEFADPALVLRDLKAVARAAAVRTVRVTGGEPLLHPDLPGLLRAIRASGAAGRTELITNGTLLTGRAAWTGLADRVQVSVYPGQEPAAADLRAFAAACRRSGTELSVRRYSHFRYCRPAAPLSAADTLAVFETCQDAHSSSCHAIGGGFLYLCLPSLAGGSRGSDRCSLTPARGLAGRLAGFLYRQRPLAACRRCLGTVGSRFRHRQAPAGKWEELSSAGRIDRRLLELLRKDPRAAAEDCCEEFPRRVPRPDLEARYDAEWGKFFSRGRKGSR